MKSKLDRFVLTVLGFTSVKIPNPDLALKALRTKFGDMQVQIVRADRVAGLEHLSLATENAVRAVGQGRARSKSVAMETLLFIAGQRQISRAVEALGATPQTKDVAVTILSKEPLNEDEITAFVRSILGGKRQDSVIDIGSRKKIRELCRTYRISPEEFDAAQLPSEKVDSLIKRLVLERSALLSTGT
jgi:tRNA threonylcarbamoyladenosine modification (KEOPS) complex Cgi121 subunit